MKVDFHPTDLARPRRRSRSHIPPTTAAACTDRRASGQILLPALPESASWAIVMSTTQRQNRPLARPPSCQTAPLYDPATLTPFARLSQNRVQRHLPLSGQCTCQAFGALSANQPSRCLTPHFANRSFSEMDRRLLGQARHGSASTTRAVRATVQRSSASLGQLRHEQGIDTKTVAKWQKRVDGRR